MCLAYTAHPHCQWRCVSLILHILAVSEDVSRLYCTSSLIVKVFLAYIYDYFPDYIAIEDYIKSRWNNYFNYADSLKNVKLNLNGTSVAKHLGDDWHWPEYRSPARCVPSIDSNKSPCLINFMGKTKFNKYWFVLERLWVIKQFSILISKFWACTQIRGCCNKNENLENLGVSTTSRCTL